MTASDERRTGLFWGFSAYFMWGFVVLYFRALGHIAPLEILAHRVVWSVVFLGAIVAVRGRMREQFRPAYRPRAILFLGVSTVLIALNWFTFIWAVDHKQVLQASLGYYINPLVNVLLGFLVLRERLTPMRRVAVGLASVAVTLLVIQQGRVPVVALVLAFSFGFYGLIRKTVPVGPLVGLTFETTLLLPVAVAYLVWLNAQGGMAFLAVDRRTDLLLVAAGVVTAIPLLCFAVGARRLDYATMGLLQFIAPSLQFAIAVLVFGEALRPVQLVAFGLIWLALGVYSLDGMRRRRRPVPG